MGARWREWARRGSSESLNTMLVEVLHDGGLSDIGRSALLEMLVRRGMGRELLGAVRRPLITRVRYLMRRLRSRYRKPARRLPGGHRETILWSRSLGRNHLVRIVETGGGISRYSIEHALELIGVWRRRRCMEECCRWIYCCLIKGTIVMALEVRGVG